MPYGAGLIVGACHLILIFAEKYYQEHKSEYTSQQQSAIEAVIAAGQALSSVLYPIYVM